MFSFHYGFRRLYFIMFPLIVHTSLSVSLFCFCFLFVFVFHKPKISSIQTKNWPNEYGVEWLDEPKWETTRWYLHCCCSFVVICAVFTNIFAFYSFLSFVLFCFVISSQRSSFFSHHHIAAVCFEIIKKTSDYKKQRGSWEKKNRHKK